LVYIRKEETKTAGSIAAGVLISHHMWICGSVAALAGTEQG